MRRFVLALSFLLPIAGFAQGAPAPVVANVPTTKVLAIGSLTGKVMPDAGIMQQEVPATVRLFLAGKIDAWYSRKATRGVVFVMNVPTVEEAHELLEKLPLGVHGLMKFDLIPLGPLGPLNYILPKQDAPAKP